MDSVLIMYGIVTATVLKVLEALCM